MDFEANNRKQGFFDISNIALILFINIILFSGVFLRFYQLEKVYSEVDDTILVAIHKAVFSDSIINKSIGPFELNITIKKELLNNLLDSPLYALFWGVRSSYPPGQFIFFPLIINESDSYYKKIFKGRLIPALFSSLSLFLFVLLLFNLNNNKLDHSFLIPTAVMAFSFNSVIYAHHMSPYSLTATTFLIAFILLNKALSNPDYTTRLFTYLAFLTIFNYLIVLTILPTSVALILSHKWYNWKKITNSLYKGFLSYILIFLPVALICLKLSHGIRGEVPPLFEEGLINYLFYFPLQFIKTASSVFASFTTNEIANMTLVSILILGGVIVLFKKFSSLGSDKYVYLYVILFFIEWTILHLFKSLTMDQTRHVLMWLPGICLIIFLIIMGK